MGSGFPLAFSAGGSAFGYDGDDIFFDGLGSDSLYGGAGNDEIYVYDGTADVIDGGAGTDFALIDRSAATVDFVFTLDPGSDAPVTLADGTTFTDVENFDIRLGAGNDTVTLILDPAIRGWQSVDFGAGTDQAVIDTTAFAGGVNVEIYVGYLRLVAGVFDNNTGYEYVFHLGSVEILEFRGGVGDDIVSGLAGNDTLAGADGSDTLYGGAGNDLVYGGNGDDVLVGDNGSDSLYGGAGNDRLLGNDGNDLLYGGDGTDTLNGGAGDDFLYGGTTEADLRDVIYGGDGNDSADGGSGNDELNGGTGNDTLVGGLGSDTIIGNEDNDFLSGTGGSDLMFGSAGDDYLNGGFGYDRLNGGEGADRFFHLGVADHGSDWVQDYNAADGDLLVTGIAGATADQFQVNLAFTPNAGDAAVAEAFVIYKPTGQIFWALVDGGGQSQINLQIGASVFDLLA